MEVLRWQERNVKRRRQRKKQLRKKQPRRKNKHPNCRKAINAQALMAFLLTMASSIQIFDCLGSCKVWWVRYFVV